MAGANKRDRDEAEDFDPVIRCWCGARGTHDELFDSAVYEQTCGGLGVLYCECGGEFCVCHHHGEVECQGCEDCEPEGDDYDGFDDCYWDDES